MWEVSTKDRPLGVFTGQPSEDAKDEKVVLPEMSGSEHVVHDYAAISLSLKAHPISFIREKLQMLHILSASDLNNAKDGQPVKVAGLVLVRQRPGTAGGICFMTIEDETGFANLVIFESLFEKYRKEIIQSRVIMVEGKLQREGEVIHVIARSCHDLTVLLRNLTEDRVEQLPLLTLSRADEKSQPQEDKRIQSRKSKDEKVFPGGRNFK